MNTKTEQNGAWIIRALSHPEYLQVIDPDLQKLCYGSNQVWFRTRWRRLSGCGPSAAANILFYQDKKENTLCRGNTKQDLLRYMETAWETITPERTGISSAELFCKKLRLYEKRSGRKIVYNVLNIPPTSHPALRAVVDFVASALENDFPVAFLNLCNGQERRLDKWHWVTIVSISYSEALGHVTAEIYDAGESKEIDLKLWLETTKKGGGFVYFKAQAPGN